MTKPTLAGVQEKLDDLASRTNLSPSLLAAVSHLAEHHTRLLDLVAHYAGILDAGADDLIRLIDRGE